MHPLAFVGVSVTEGVAPETMPLTVNVVTDVLVSLRRCPDPTPSHLVLGPLTVVFITIAELIGAMSVHFAINEFTLVDLKFSRSICYIFHDTLTCTFPLQPFTFVNITSSEVAYSNTITNTI